MLLWLTNAGWRRAGYVVALIYAICALAPSVALASSHCLVDENHGEVALHGHSGGLSQIHDAAEHMSAQAQAASADHAAPHEPSDLPATAKIPHGATCCGSVSVPSLPLGTVELLEPLSQRSSYLPEAFSHLSDSEPPTLYRPPIS